MNKLIAGTLACVWTAAAVGAGWQLNSGQTAPAIASMQPAASTEAVVAVRPLESLATGTPVGPRPTPRAFATPNSVYQKRATNAQPLLDEAWSKLSESYVGDLPSNQQRDHAAIKGALEAVGDKYTNFLEPRNRQIEREHYAGKFAGIGVNIVTDAQGRVVLAPTRNTPAERAGVLRGDVLIKVDDWEIPVGTDFNDVASRVRGDVGTIVRITVLRDGSPLEISITRAIIEVASVEWRMITETGKTTFPVGYISVRSFTERTGAETRQAITDLQAAGAKGWVLDLRGNGGGLLSAAQDVVSQFLRDGNVLIERKKSGETAWPVTKGGLLSNDNSPMAVLVNANSASASEITAGALQDAERAVVVGEKTYGKGSVQLLYDLSDGSSVHVTSAKWLTPKRRTIEDVGIQPDIIVTVDATTRDRDNQLERALRHINGG